MWLWSVRHKWKIGKIAVAFGRCAITSVLAYAQTHYTIIILSLVLIILGCVRERRIFARTRTQTHASQSWQEQRRQQQLIHTQREHRSKKSSARNFKLEREIYRITRVIHKNENGPWTCQAPNKNREWEKVVEKHTHTHTVYGIHITIQDVTKKKKPSFKEKWTEMKEPNRVKKKKKWKKSVEWQEKAGDFWIILLVQCFALYFIVWIRSTFAPSLNHSMCPRLNPFFSLLFYR